MNADTNRIDGVFAHLRRHISNHMVKQKDTHRYVQEFQFFTGNVINLSHNFHRGHKNIINLSLNFHRDHIGHKMGYGCVRGCKLVS